MKKYVLILLFAGIVFGCGNNEEKKDSKPQVSIGTQSTATKTATPKKVEKAGIDLDNKGVGVIKSVELGEINQGLVDAGKEHFKMYCTACHKVDKKFIGPAPTGIMERRSAEWIMNMILDPELMVKEDPIARQLLIEHNGSPMANQGLDEAEARAILEYFRTL